MGGIVCSNAEMCSCGISGFGSVHKLFKIWVNLSLYKFQIGYSCKLMKRGIDFLLTILHSTLSFSLLYH